MRQTFALASPHNPRMINLAGRVAIITGASRGIGLATAIKFAEAGIRGLVINDNNNRDAASEVARQCERSGAEVISIKADVSRSAAVKKMIKVTLDRFGSL